MNKKLGQGFADFISKNKGYKRDRRLRTKTNSVRGRNQWERYRNWRRRFFEPRVIPFFVVFVLGMGVLFLRLFWITLIKGGYYRSLSEENRLREEVIWAPRGIIYDRDGKALVLNRPVYRKSQESRPKDDQPLAEKLKSQKYEYLTQEEVLGLEARGEAEDIELFVSREYPYAEAFANVVGYVGEVDKDDVKAGLRLGSLVGKTGLEQAFDSVLRGEDGKVLLETDAVGKKIGELGRIDAKPGGDLYTTLDAELQVAVVRAMNTTPGDSLQETSGTSGRPGAVVVSKPDTGEILVLYSSPSFDPNLFVKENKWEVGEVLEDPSRPLFNRAISGVYPPGSTFKPLVAAAALEEKAINAETTFEDKGYIAIGPYLFRNWYYTQYGRTEGKVDVVGGIARSVDTFFYRVGEKLGIDALVKWARLFGIGKKVGIEIAGEVEGRMPDRKWKFEAKGERWYLGDTYHVSIGQGDILTTPLQVDFFIAAIANGGKLCRPRLVKSKEQGTKSKEQGTKNKEQKEQKLGESVAKCENLGLKEETLRLIKTGMRKACEPGGTGFPLFNFTVSDEGVVDPWATRSAELKGARRIPVACKTGTAEFGDAEGKTHAWFTVFAPVKKPEIVVTVLLEGGGSGAYDAAPIARKILGEYFRQNTTD